MINCIIIEDAPLAMQKLEGFIEQFSYIEFAKIFYQRH
jgi:hypothetical protein